MKHNVHTSKGPKASRPSDLLKRLSELQKLRKQVRLAEAAIRPRPQASQVGRS